MKRDYPVQNVLGEFNVSQLQKNSTLIFAKSQWLGDSVLYNIIRLNT